MADPVPAPKAPAPKKTPQDIAADLFKFIAVSLGVLEFSSGIGKVARLSVAKLRDLRQRLRGFVTRTVVRREVRVVAPLVVFAALVSALLSFLWNISVIDLYHLPNFIGDRYYWYWWAAILIPVVAYILFCLRYMWVQDANLLATQTPEEQLHEELRAAEEASKEDEERLVAEIAALAPAPPAPAAGATATPDPYAARRAELPNLLSRAIRSTQHLHDTMMIVNATPEFSVERDRRLEWARSDIAAFRLYEEITRDFPALVPLQEALDGIQSEIDELPAGDPDIATLQAQHAADRRVLSRMRRFHRFERLWLRLTRLREECDRIDELAVNASMNRDQAAEELRGNLRYFDPNSPSGRAGEISLLGIFLLLYIEMAVEWQSIYIQSLPATRLYHWFREYAAGGTPLTDAFLSISAVPSMFTYPIKAFAVIPAVGVLILCAIYQVVSEQVFGVAHLITKASVALGTEGAGAAIPIIEAAEIAEGVGEVNFFMRVRQKLTGWFTTLGAWAVGTPLSAMFVPSTAGYSLMIYGLTRDQIDWLRAHWLLWPSVVIAAMMFVFNLTVWLVYKHAHVETEIDQHSLNQKAHAFTRMVPIALFFGLGFNIPMIPAIIIHGFNGLWEMPFLKGVFFLAIVAIVGGMAMTALSDISSEGHKHGKRVIALMSLIIFGSWLWGVANFVSPPLTVAEQRQLDRIRPNVDRLHVQNLRQINADLRILGNEREVETRQLERRAAGRADPPRPPPPPPPPVVYQTAAVAPPSRRAYTVRREASRDSDDVRALRQELGQ